MIQRHVRRHEIGAAELFSIFADAAALLVLQLHHPGELLAVDAGRIVDHAVGIGEGHRLGAEIDLLDLCHAEFVGGGRREQDADLIVVGNRGMSGVRRFVLGSVPNRLSHHCPSSLLIVDTSVD